MHVTQIRRTISRRGLPIITAAVVPAHHLSTGSVVSEDSIDHTAAPPWRDWIVTRYAVDAAGVATVTFSPC